MIPISRRRGLRATLELLGTLAPREAVDRGLIQDPWGGYEAWQRRTARVVTVAWPGIRLEPIQGSIRVVRDYVRRLGRDRLDPQLERRLRRAVLAGSDLDTGYLDARNLLKVLSDPTAARELKLLERLGVFEVWLEGLGEQLADLDIASLESMLTIEDPSKPWVEQRLVSLLTPLAAPAREAVLQAVAVPEREVSERVRRRLEHPAAV
ncbi:MAG: hypothetical protein AAF725_13340 [Acidobacteriota bacterium]